SPYPFSPLPKAEHRTSPIENRFSPFRQDAPMHVIHQNWMRSRESSTASMTSFMTTESFPSFEPSDLNLKNGVPAHQFALSGSTAGERFNNGQHPAGTFSSFPAPPSHDYRLMGEGREDTDFSSSNFSILADHGTYPLLADDFAKNNPAFPLESTEDHSYLDSSQVIAVAPSGCGSTPDSRRSSSAARMASFLPSIQTTTAAFDKSFALTSPFPSSTPTNVPSSFTFSESNLFQSSLVSSRHSPASGFATSSHQSSADHTLAFYGDMNEV
ncbi:hypothetical protein HDU91_003866, partial [Kappamyces sp. JEL0680]